MPDPNKLYRDALRTEDFARAAVLAKTVSLGLARCGSTAFYLAAASGATEAARVLLDRGADPHLCSPGEWSPARRACLAGGDEIVRMLFERGFIPDDERPYLLEAALSLFDRVRRVAEDPALERRQDRLVEPHDPGEQLFATLELRKHVHPELVLHGPVGIPRVAERTDRGRLLHPGQGIATHR